MFSPVNNVETVVPHPGESLIAAILRCGDPLAGSGLSEGDRQAIHAQDHAGTHAKLAACAQRCAEQALTIARLQAELAAARAVLADTNGLVAALMDIIEAEVDKQQGAV